MSKAEIIRSHRNRGQKILVCGKDNQSLYPKFRPTELRFCNKLRFSLQPKLKILLDKWSKVLNIKDLCHPVAITYGLQNLSLWH